MEDKEFMKLKAPQGRWEIYRVMIDIRKNNNSYLEVWRKLFLSLGSTPIFQISSIFKSVGKNNG